MIKITANPKDAPGFCATMPVYPCRYCGRHHYVLCPRIKRIEYYENGTQKIVEFHEADE